MAISRAYWKGYLKLSLVTCPVALYPASSQAEKTHFNVTSVLSRGEVRGLSVGFFENAVGNVRPHFFKGGEGAGLEERRDYSGYRQRLVFRAINSPIGSVSIATLSAARK